MKRCAAKPYEGQEKYIFISYCHRDRALVFPIIEQLTKDGYRVWYDEGIDPGSEWPEIIATHLDGSAICIAFLTANSLDSHNCRREINFALLKKKYFISIVLGPIQMSLGMEMQLSSFQSIYKYTLSSDEEFFTKLYKTKELEKCKGSPNECIQVSTPNDYNYEMEKLDKSSDSFCENWFVQGSDMTSIGDTQHCKSEETARETVEEENYQKAEEVIRKDVEEETDSIHMLKREKSGELITIRKSPFKIGRSKSLVDYVITDNSLISRRHATLLIRNDICYIVDNNSLNKTFVNDVALVPETENALSNGDNVRLYNERFVYQKYCK